MQETKVQNRIINHFLNNGNVPDYNQNIVKSIGAQKSGVAIQCKKLKNNEILTSKMDHVKSRGKTPHYYLASSIMSLMEVYEYANKSDLIRSDYYKKMIPDVVKCFETSIKECDTFKVVVEDSTKEYDIHTVVYGAPWEAPTENDLIDNIEYLRDTCNLKLQTSGDILSSEDRINIAESLESSISALKFIKHFISLNPLDRWNLILNIECDLKDPYYTPIAAYINGYTVCIDDMRAYVNIPENTLKIIYMNLKTKRQDEPVYFWSSFFNMIDKFDTHYPFLFE